MITDHFQLYNTIIDSIVESSKEITKSEREEI